MDFDYLDLVSSVMGIESFVKGEEPEVNVTEMDPKMEISGSSVGPKVHVDRPTGKAG